MEVTDEDRGLEPLDSRLPTSIEELLPWRLALGQALQQAMSMKAAADETIAEFFGDRTEAVVGGVTYQFDGAKSWEIADAAKMLALLTQLEADGAITTEDYHHAVTITPQPDLVRIDNVFLNQLVRKRGLRQIDELRIHRTGNKRLRRVA